MTFVCNVNTREISQDPNNIMIDFVSNIIWQWLRQQ